jgi:hypothetical protein
LGGSGRHLIEVLSRDLPRETERNHKQSVRRAGVPVEIRTEHPLNENLGYYLCTTLFSTTGHLINICIECSVSRDSSVCIATVYELDCRDITTTPSVARTVQRRMVERLRNDRVGKDVKGYCFMLLYRYSTLRTRESHKEPQDIRCPSRNSNRVAPGYKSEALPPK